jgi:hypothetical protein
MITCFACNIAFDSSFQLISHFSEHVFPLDTTFKCLDCVHNFNSLSGLVGHLNKKHLTVTNLPTEVQSDHSNLMTSSSKIFQMFKFPDGYSPLTDYEVGNILEKSERSLKLYENEKSFKQINYFNCQFCDKNFSEQNQIGLHVRLNHSNQQNQSSTSSFTNKKQTENLCDETKKIIVNFKAAILLLTLQFFGNENISRKQACESLKNTFETYKIIISLFQVFSSYLSNDRVKHEFDSLILYIQNFEFSSEYKLFAELKKMGLLIEAFDHIIDQRSFLVKNVPKINTHLMKIMPLRKLMTKIFEMKNFKESLFSHLEFLENSSSDIISNIIQSPFWFKKLSMLKKTENTLYIPITIFFDDFEPLNALAGHAGAYKIGGVYTQIACLPPHLQSQLDFILMAALFFSEDRKSYGNERIFVRIVEEFNSLQETGISIDYKSYTTVKFVPILIVGDNLGLNGILGFTESFSHTYFCRFCKLTKSFTHILTFTPETLLRTPTNYDADINLENYPGTGIIEVSPFNKLANFHAADNPSVDIMHDVLEGVIHFDIGKILNQFIFIDKVFSLETLNFRLQGTDYGPNKKLTTLISQDMIKNNRFKFSASEAFVFVKYLSIAIGDLIPPDCLEWKLYIILRKILTIIMTRDIPRGLSKILNELIKEHHTIYLTLYKKLEKCKLHLMTHYEMAMDLIGPLLTTWSMRFEGKHQIFLRISNVNRCKKNLVHTLAFKHQLKMANLMFNKDCALETFIADEMIIMTKSEFQEQYKIEIMEDSVKVTENACYQGHTLETDAVISYGEEIVDLPLFGMIQCIFSTGESYFVCLERLTSQFNEHFYAYEAKKTKNIFVINLEAITNFKTSHLLTNPNGELMIVWD